MNTSCNICKLATQERNHSLNHFCMCFLGISPAMLNKTITITSHSCRKQLGSGSEIEMGCGTSIFDNNSATSEDFLHEDRVKISLKNNNDPHLPAPDFSNCIVPNKFYSQNARGKYEFSVPDTVAIQLEMSTSNLPLSVTLAWGQIPECDNHQRILTQTFSKNGFLLVKEMNSGEFSSGNCFSILFQMPPNEKRLTVQDIYYIKIQSQ